MKYILTIGIDKFYLTQEERDFYLQQINNGAKYIAIKDRVFGSNFQSLVPEESAEEYQKLQEGQFKCSFGKWHSKGDQCIHYFSQGEDKMKSIKGAIERKQLAYKHD